MKQKLYLCRTNTVKIGRRDLAAETQSTKKNQLAQSYYVCLFLLPSVTNQGLEKEQKPFVSSEIKMCISNSDNIHMCTYSTCPQGGSYRD